MECESPYRSSNGSEGHTRGLHLFEDLFIFEIVDEYNQPVPPGHYGDKVLLTVLFNYTQPLIRYELSDSVRMATRPCSCKCPFVLIEDVQGRSEEELRFSGCSGKSVAVHPMVFYRILDAAPVNGWQVVQEDGRLTLRLSGESGMIHEQSLVNQIRDALARQSVAPPEISVDWITGVERGLSGKAARIVSRR